LSYKGCSTPIKGFACDHMRLFCLFTGSVK
jgi:hypothetical protein